MSSQPSPQQRTTRDPRRETAVTDDVDLPEDRRVAALMARLDRARRVQSNQMDLGTADLRILWLFADGRARTLKEISTELRLEQSTVNRQVNAAMAEGLLQRSRRPGSVAHEISRTERGSEIFEADVATALRAFGAGLDGLGDRVDDFLTDLTRFVDAYDKEVGLEGEGD